MFNPKFNINHNINQHAALIEKSEIKPEEPTPPFHLDDFSNEIKYAIFSHLSLQEKYANRVVSKSFCDILQPIYLERFKPLNIIEMISQTHQRSIIQKFLSAYHASKEYTILRNKNLDSMHPHELICFALTRCAKDTRKLKYNKLQNAINKVSDLPENIKITLSCILSAIQYSETIHPTTNASNPDELKKFIRQREEPYTFVNLSGLNLNKIDLGDILRYQFDLIDFSSSNLKEATIGTGRNFLEGIILIDANITKIHIGTLAAIGSPKKNPDTTIQFFPLTAFDNPKALQQQIEKVWEKQFKTQDSHRCDAIKAIYEAIVCNLVKTIRSLKASPQHKLDLLHVIMHHPMFKVSHAAQFLKVNTINNFAHFFSPNQYNRKYHPYFRDYRVFAHSIDKFKELKNEIIALNRVKKTTVTNFKPFH